MNEREQRIAIAEACGWKWFRQPSTGPWAVKPMRSLYHPELMKLQGKPFALADMTERECNPAFMWREGLVPDYTQDLNAIHEAEKTLSLTDKLRFMDYLRSIVCPSPQYLAVEVALMIHATAPQRAEAFVRVKGLWKETTPPTKAD